MGLRVEILHSLPYLCKYSSVAFGEIIVCTNIPIPFIIPQKKFGIVDMPHPFETCATFPEAERELWHSNVYEVKTGWFLAPDLSQQAEVTLSESAIQSYAKVFHTWDVSVNDTAPYGIPKLLFGYTAQNQANAEMRALRDDSFPESRAAALQSRKGIQKSAPSRIVGADFWETGPIVVDVEQIKTFSPVPSH